MYIREWEGKYIISSFHTLFMCRCVYRSNQLDGISQLHAHEATPTNRTISRIYRVKWMGVAGKSHVQYRWKSCIKMVSVLTQFHLLEQFIIIVLNVAAIGLRKQETTNFSFNSTRRNKAAKKSCRTTIEKRVKLTLNRTIKFIFFAHFSFRHIHSLFTTECVVSRQIFNLQTYIISIIVILTPFSIFSISFLLDSIIFIGRTTKYF